jgi:aerobic-type carbon monoxide dehydrogenase small subunit (CoxS/CutS family)
MMSARTINFTLNGEAVSTTIEPHRNLVELPLFRDLGRRQIGLHRRAS